ncbi:MAG: thioesterase domain-containing protein, partial [Flavobacteriales bacterium]
VEQHLGYKLPLSSLFQAPTVALFAALVKKDEKPLALKNLALIQKEGNKPPLFCVHGDEANHHITRYLGKGQPYYAFFHQGEDGAAFEHKTVEAIAKHYVAEMTSVQPEGPYMLGGYSFGGIVAYEMACQLKAAGHDVPLLALFDMPIPKHFIESMDDDAKFYQPLKRTVMRWLVQLELRRGKIRSLKLRHFHIIDNYDKAILAYRPKPYSGPVTIFKAERTPGPDDMGWSTLVTGPLDIKVLPGDHYSLIKDPEVVRLVKELSVSIDRAVGKHAVEAV